MTRVIKFACAVLIFGWSSLTFGQNECGSRGLQTMQVTSDFFGVNHQVECYDPLSGKLTLPFARSILTGALNNTQYASRFLTPSDDCGSKIMACDSFLGTKGGVCVVDSACGTTWTNPVNLHNSLVFNDSATYTINCPLLVSVGGIAVSGTGLDNSGGNQIGTAIQCSAPGKDVISVLGTSANRISHVIISGVFVLGGGSSRYGLRFEKVDQMTVQDSAFFNHGTANVYGVDSTGDYWHNDRIANIPVNGMVLDWGTGQFTGVGLVFESLVCNTAPMLTVQGSGSGQSFFGTTMQLDGCSGNWAGFVSVAGFDVNSSFAGAPTGGGGAPVGPGFYNLNETIAGTPNNPTQGADNLVSGTAANPTQDVVFKQSQDFGNSHSNVAYKFDQSKGGKVVFGFSNGHTTATFNPTNNALFTQAWGETSLDTAVCAGTCPSGIAIINSQNKTGRMDFSSDIGIGATPNLLFSQTSPTISSGFGTSPSIVQPNGTTSFQVNVGTGGTANSGVLGLPTAANGWNCTCDDKTTFSTTVFRCRQTSDTTATATIGNFNTSAAAAAWVASDILYISCTAR